MSNPKTKIFTRKQQVGLVNEPVCVIIPNLFNTRMIGGLHRAIQHAPKGSTFHLAFTNANGLSYRPEGNVYSVPIPEDYTFDKTLHPQYSIDHEARRAFFLQAFEHFYKVAKLFNSGDPGNGLYFNFKVG